MNVTRATAGAPVLRSHDLDRVAALLPGYDIGEELGRGGWGVVIAGRHKRLDRPVAIKQLPRAFGVNQEVRARFIAEAQLLASLDHPHIVPIYDFVEGGGLCLLVMELLRGGTLWQRFMLEGLAMPSACSVTLATCAALGTAHGRGILHRDIKPENIMFSGNGVVKVTDFGIAKVLGGGQTFATRAGEVIGTPAYMAPEQAQAKDLSPATDIYAAGVMLYELLSGHLPFPDDGDPLSQIHRRIFEDPMPLSEVAPHVPSQLIEPVMRALARDHQERYDDAEKFGMAIAGAATEAWGPGWLASDDFAVMAGGPMVALTERPTPRPEDLDDAGATGHGGPGAPLHVPSLPPTVRVQPATTHHTVGALAPEDDGLDLVALHEMARPPARMPALVAGGLAALTLLVALIGIGSPPRSGNLPKDAVTVAGHDPAAAGTISVDLAQSIPMVVTLASGANASDRVRLTLSAGGFELGSGQSAIVPGDSGQLAADVNVSASRYLVAGRATADIAVMSDGQVLRHRSFTLRSKRASLLTVPAMASLALLLFVLGYCESLSRTLRHRRGLVGPTAGLIGLGAAAGLAFVGVAWPLVGTEPLVPTIVVCMILGGGAGFAAAVASARSRPRRRRAPEVSRGRAPAAAGRSSR